jgi:hypothetical protein
MHNERHHEHARFDVLHALRHPFFLRISTLMSMTATLPSSLL